MEGMVRYLFRTVFPPRRVRLPVVLGGVMATAFMAGAGGGYADPDAPHARPLTLAEMGVLENRVHHVSGLYAGASAYVDSSVRPIESVILRQRGDVALAKRVAVSLVRNSNRLRLNRHLMLGMLLVENPNVNPRARSRVGARGLMQVMPDHRGRFPCGTNLDDVDTNICYGAHVFRENLKEAGGDVENALLRYNGCIRGTNTPDCRHYPDWVFSRAARARLHPLAH